MSLLLFNNNDEPAARRRKRLTPGGGAPRRTGAVLIGGAITFAAVFVVTALVADSVSEGAARTFYGLAAQILPVFLVTLALEQSLSERLGTEGDFAADVADREASRLRDRRGEITTILEFLLSLWRIPEYEDAAFQNRILLDSLADERAGSYGFNKDYGYYSIAVERILALIDTRNPDSAEDLKSKANKDEISALSFVVLASGGAADFAGHKLDWYSRKYGDKLGDEARQQYRTEKKLRGGAFAALLSILAVGEIASLAGVLLDGFRSPVLFGAVSACVGATTVMVTGLAIRDFTS